MAKITSIFFDLGGVCLSNGWDHEQRQEVAASLGFDYEIFDSRHRQVVDALERGQLSLHDYLQWTLFYQPRSFSMAEVVAAMEDLSTCDEKVIDLLRALRAGGRYRLMTLNNESRELNEFRIAEYDLRNYFLVFFSSCYLGLIKPQPEMYRRVLAITQCPPEECLFIDDRPMNVEVGRILGMNTILFKDATQLELDLRTFGIEF
jgi:putative hydrolase of the HAD superfamily